MWLHAENENLSAEKCLLSHTNAVFMGTAPAPLQWWDTVFRCCMHESSAFVLLTRLWNKPASFFILLTNKLDDFSTRLLFKQVSGDVESLLCTHSTVWVHCETGTGALKRHFNKNKEYFTFYFSRQLVYRFILRKLHRPGM